MTADTRLWYRQPAQAWENALPIGNGRLGAMVFGQVRDERWQLNEDSIWYGGPRDRTPKNALESLPRLRMLLDEGRILEAEELAQTAFIAIPEVQRHYEPLGQVDIYFPHHESQVSNYCRELDLTSALTSLAYDLDGVRYSRELFSSYPAGVIASKLSASEPGKISFRMRLNRRNKMPMTKVNDVREIDTCAYMDTMDFIDGCIILTATTGGKGITLSLAAKVVIRGGTLQCIGDTVVVRCADAAYIYLAGETDFRHSDPRSVGLSHLAVAATVGYEQLLDAHLRDYRALFHRVSLQLGNDDQCRANAAVPTDKRMEEARRGHADTSLAALYFHFGRYLLISSSRPGFKALPANLQGIWNEDTHPAWGSKFTININAEMNYWPAETANLSECHEPFLWFLERLQERGERTARIMYGCRGWTAHHNTDIWADTDPQDRVIDCTVWPMGAAWMSTHIMEHFAFTGDTVFLSRAYPILRGSVEFFIDFLIERDGYVVTSPSVSPENSYLLPSGQKAALDVAPTMDIHILRQLFTDFLEAAQALGKAGEEEREMVAKVSELREKLPPLRIGRYGQLQEWSRDYEDAEPGHRHVSHLWGLFPGSSITTHDAKLATACRRSLERRAQHGGGHTGWSRAWMIALWARLRDGAEAARHIEAILRTSTHDSLLDDHPPFQIDGNFGATAGIIEMLVQSHGGEIHLLPCLPPAWEEGWVRGLRCRGGFEVGLAWKLGRLVGGSLISLRGADCTLSASVALSITGPDGSRVADFDPTSGKSVWFGTESGAEYIIAVP